MHYPQMLKPNSIEPVVLPGGQTVHIPKTRVGFAPARIEGIVNDYGGKPLLEWEGRPAFAELIVLWSFQSEGWKGVWVDSYRRKYRVGLLNVAPVDLPPPQQALLDSLRQEARRGGGAWDVYCWRDDQVLFAEVKRIGHDRLRQNQRLFLEAALGHNLSGDNFMIVEWDLCNQGSPDAARSGTTHS